MCRPEKLRKVIFVNTLGQLNERLPVMTTLALYDSINALPAGLVIIPMLLQVLLYLQRGRVVDSRYMIFSDELSQADRLGSLVLKLVELLYLEQIA